jgi:hypothetical protein
MKRLEIITNGTTPGRFLDELDYHKYQEEIDHWQMQNSVIKIFGNSDCFVQSMASVVDFAKTQDWFVSLSLKCISQEEFFQEKL